MKYRTKVTVQKAIDYIDVILIRQQLAGIYYMEEAIAVIKGESA